MPRRLANAIVAAAISAALLPVAVRAQQVPGAPGAAGAATTSVRVNFVVKPVLSIAVDPETIDFGEVALDTASSFRSPVPLSIRVRANTPWRRRRAWSRESAPPGPGVDASESRRRGPPSVEESPARQGGPGAARADACPGRLSGAHLRSEHGPERPAAAPGPDGRHPAGHDRQLPPAHRAGPAGESRGGPSTGP